MRSSNGANDQDTSATLRALRRAARNALDLGIRTGTPVYVIKGGRIVDLTKQVISTQKKQSKTRRV